MDSRLRSATEVARDPQDLCELLPVLILVCVGAPPEGVVDETARELREEDCFFLSLGIWFNWGQPAVVVQPALGTKSHTAMTVHLPDHQFWMW